MSEPSIPSPGSPDAISRGCRCPRYDNGYGYGAYTNERGEPQFWISGECKLHAEADAPVPKDPATFDLFAEGGC